MSTEINSVTASPLLHNAAATPGQGKVPSSAPEKRQAVSVAPEKAVNPTTKVDRAQLDQALAGLVRQTQVRGARVQFEIKDHYGEIVLQVLDAESRELVRQIPAEEVLKLAKFFRDLEAAQGNASILDAKNLAAGLSFWEGLLIDTSV